MISGNKNGFLQVSFAWLFAIIIGAIILVFAIYAATRLINTEKNVSNTEVGKEISVLLNPLEISFESAKTTPLTLPVESRIENSCNGFGKFGEQKIAVSQKSFGKWSDTGIGSVTYDKYIFSNQSVQGKKFYLFSKPFELPFKVADLIFMTSSEDNYCFLNSPDSVEEEITNLNQGNLFVQNCPKDSINVCFKNQENCDVVVNVNLKSVEKDGETVYFETDSLMYGAIFSDMKTYECQVQRLMDRLYELSLIYDKKEAIISSQGCAAEVNVINLGNSAYSVKDSSDLIYVKSIASQVDSENKYAYCRLW